MLMLERRRALSSMLGLSVELSVGLVLALGLVAPSHAHGTMPRTKEGQSTAARLFTADSSNGQVVAIDLPSGEIVARLQTPPLIISMGLDAERRYVVALRGRNTDRDTVSVIDGGFDAAGLAHYPAVVSTFTGESPGGIREGLLATVGGHTALFQEMAGAIDVYERDDFGAPAGVAVRRIKLAVPDHYHYLEAGKFLYVGYLGKGYVQVLARDSGREKARIGPCPVLHGMAKDEASGRLFYGCMRDILVIGTQGKEQNREVARIAYPGQQRVAAFRTGKGGVLWGLTEGAIPALQRLDPSRQPYVFETIPVESVIQTAVTEDGNYLVLYSRKGQLDIRDGGTGSLLHTLPISQGFAAEYHEHVDKALLPGIVFIGGNAWVTVPTEGAVVEVELSTGKELRRIAIGGEPTRLVVVEPRAPAGTAASATDR